MKETTNLTVDHALKREARLAAGRRLISLSEFTELAWRKTIEEEHINGTNDRAQGPDGKVIAPAPPST